MLGSRNTFLEEIPMRLRLLILLLTLVAVARPLAAQTDRLRIDINIPANRLVVYEDARVLRTYPISVGLPGHNTPMGSFKISRAEWNPWWRPPEREWAKDDVDTPPGPNNPMGRVKLFFMPLYFIHGTPDHENMGRPASHGCVRMLNRDVIALSRLLHARAAKHVASAEIDRILSRSGQTRRVDFKAEIPLAIRYDLVAVEDGKLLVYPDVYKRNSVHAEGVYQALLAAGYDVSAIDRSEIQKLVQRVRGRKTVYSVAIAEAFGGRVAAGAGR